MKSYLKKLGMIFIMFLVAVGIGVIQNGIVAKAATIGQQLSKPEDGWRRYDDTDSRIKYVGDGLIKNAGGDFYNGSESEVQSSQNSALKIQFKFQGTKLRIISLRNPVCGSSISISIDGVKETFSIYDGSGNHFQTLVYEKNSLSNSIHTVEMTNNSNFMCLDAIDIDSTGELKFYDGSLPIAASGISLNKTSECLEVGQADNLITTVTPDNTTDKNVTWASSDSSIATVDSNGKVTALKAGTVNIIATTTDGSNLSTKCTVTVFLGKQLLQPEDGWRRYDDTDSRIKYVGDGWIKNTGGDFYNGSESEVQSSQNSASKIQFKFQGTKLRIISLRNPVCGNSISIYIDGVKQTFNIYDGSGNHFQTLVYEKNSLSNSIHTVEITNTSNFMCLDAIDIDSTGELVSYDQNVQVVATGISLNKTTDNLQVGQADNLVATVTPDNATNKNVTWTSSDPTVATVDSNGKVTALKAGTVSITAKTTDGSNLSMACTVTVADVPPVNPTEDRAVLTITMANNIIKTYDLSEDELNAFIKWYDSRANGIGHAFYVFENKANAGNISNKDYISYDRIEYFNVQEYKVK
ncbi:Ig-like domain-containing protein [Clostridium cibarium]|uniref:Ig domain-containing protein n=1 Tax=Clostridium cibarium TaxID=2762247 RepID=A0ABR8PTC9_9CLOT|nr:Ig-like domain-containing protein [Clostridium cibarium]MBD7911443.1 Ig domain-containing protein [Clostridium cibarium]